MKVTNHQGTIVAYTGRETFTLSDADRLSPNLKRYRFYLDHLTEEAPTVEVLAETPCDAFNALGASSNYEARRGDFRAFITAYHENRLYCFEVSTKLIPVEITEKLETDDEGVRPVLQEAQEELIPLTPFDPFRAHVNYFALGERKFMVLTENYEVYEAMTIFEDKGIEGEPHWQEVQSRGKCRSAEKALRDFLREEVL